MKSFAITVSLLMISSSSLISSVMAFATTDGKNLSPRQQQQQQQQHLNKHSSITGSSSTTRLFAGVGVGRSEISQTKDEFLEIELNVPPKRSGVIARLKFPPVFPGPSELIEVRYDLPFGLNVEPKENLAICTKDGDGGEKVGDVLRYTSQWTMGLPQGDGAVSTVASFAGGISWQCSLFDVMKSKDWPRVIEALTSNVESRTDEVVLIFERSLE